MSGFVFALTYILPWATVAVTFGVALLKHIRAKSAQSDAKHHKTIEELHGLYHDLVSDLGEQVERLVELNKSYAQSNEDLTRANRELMLTVEELSSECAALRKTVKQLTTRVRALEQSEKALKEQMEAHNKETE